MKSKRLLLLLLLAIGLPWAAMAQETVEIGTDGGTTTNNYLPAYTMYNNTLSEQIYTAEEVTMAGTISSISFYNGGSTKSPEIKLYLVNTDKNEFTSITDWLTVTADDLVFDGTVTFTAGEWTTIEFTNEFEYDGTSNLGVVVDEHMQWSSGLACRVFTSTDNCSLYHYDDNVNFDATNPASGNYSNRLGVKNQIKLEITPAQSGGDVCEKPATCEVSDVTSTSATLTWSGGSGTYNVEVKGGSYADWTAVLEGTNLTTTTLTLQPTTSYQARVQSVCDGDTPTSSWKTSSSFTTPCDTYNIPYTYDFEAEAPFACWTPNAGVTRGNGSSYANNSSYYLRFAGTTSNLVALPQFNEATNNLRVEFWTRPESSSAPGSYSNYSGKFAVGYMTDITDASTFVAVDTYIASEMTTSYVKKTVDLVNAPAGANIAMRQFDCATNYYWFVDDITVKAIPSCLAPTDLAATASTTSAELSWTANSGETAWTVYYKKTTDENYTEVANATNPYTLNGLTAATNYQYYVVANCSTDNASEPSEVFTFATACDVIDALGYSENFDGYTGATSGSTNNLPLCWNYINTCTYSSYKGYPVIYSGSSYSNSGNNHLRFYSYYSSYSNYDPQNQYAILPEMSGLAGKEVVLYARGYNTSSTFKIGTMSDPEDANTFSLIEEQTGLTTSYQKFSYIIPADRTDGYLVIMIDAATSSRTSNGVYIDDITVKEMVTVDADEIVAANPGEGQMTWSQFAQHVNNGDHFTSNTFTLMEDIIINEMVGTEENPFTGIFEGNNKTITADITSGEKAAGPFHYIKDATIRNLTMTGSVVETTTTSDGFHVGGLVGYISSGTNTIQNCHVSTDITITTLGGGIVGHASNSTLNLIGCVYDGDINNTTPDTDGNRGVGGLVGWCGNNATLNLNSCVFDGTYGGDGASVLFHPVVCGTGNVNNSVGSRSTFTNVYYTLDQQGTDSGSVNVISNCGKHAYTITGESPVTVEMSGTATPYNLSGITAYANNSGLLYNNGIIAGDGETVSLTLGGAAGYEANHGTLVANGDVFTLTMEAYDTEISAVDCPVPYNVAVSNVEARSAQVTWNGGSDSYTLGYAQAVETTITYDFENNGIPAEFTNDATYPWTIVESGHEGSYSMKSGNGGKNSTTSGIDYEVTLANEATLTFWAKISSEGNYDKGYFTIDGNTQINGISDNGSWIQYTYTLAAGSHTLRWYYTKDTSQASNDDCFYVDDITISSLTAGSYTTIDNITASPYTIENLTPETAYFVRVKGNCGGVETDYSDVVSFTTPASCVAPTGLAVSGITATGASFSWDAEEGATWQYCTFTLPHADPTDADFSSSTTYNTASWPNAFIPSSQQIFWLRKDCGNGEYSQPVSVEFTMLDACVNLTCTAVTTTTATLSWTDNAYGVNSWQVMLNNDAEHLITVTMNPCTLTDLTAATAYTAKVRAAHGNCVGGYTDWSNEVSFTTECEVITVDLTHPFTEGFEGTTFAPICWESIASASGTYAWSRSTSYHHGDGSASAYSGWYGDIYLVMPDIQISSEVGGAQLSFWSYNRYVSDYDKNSVVLINGENETELWSPESVSESWVETTIDLSNYVGQTISLAFKYEGDNAHGWYIDDVELIALKTITKEIAGYGTSEKGGYYLIASPVVENVTPAANNGFIAETAANYDLYYFNQAAPVDAETGIGLEWINFKDAEDGNFAIENGKGYLYASKEGTTLSFTGTPYSGNGQVPLVTTAGAEWAGWNLVGNPFGEDATIDRDCYVMNTEGRAEIIATDNRLIPAMEGAFVIANSAEDVVPFVAGVAEAGGNDSKLVLNLTKNNSVLDRAMVRFGEGSQLPKFQLRKSSTKVYIPQENVDYAVVYSEGMGEMPVNFKAEENGSYTLCFGSSKVSFAYLHLIDNMTGIETDLLANPSYSFDARTTDYESRFKLVFATGNNANDDAFAFYSNGSFIINNEGEATLQVIDMNGRILKNESINGCANVNVKAAAGVYMLRLVNGNDVKVQKVVVR